MLGSRYVRQEASIYNQKTFKYRHMCNMLFVAWQEAGVHPQFHPDERFKYDREAVAHYLIDTYDNDTLDKLHTLADIRFPVRKGRPSNALAKKTIAKLGDSLAQPTEYKEYLFGPVPPPPPPSRQIPSTAERAETIAFETPLQKIVHTQVGPFSVYTKEESESKKSWAEDAEVIDEVIDNELEIGLETTDDSVYITRKEMKGILTELTQSLNRILQALDVYEESD